jgi:hypothetical protein
VASSRPAARVAFLSAYLTTVGACALPVALSALVLLRAGELQSYAADVQLQQRTNALLGLATFQNFYTYKLAVARARQSPILAIGSSRVMPFRQGMFDGGFTNAGGAMNSIEQGARFLQEMAVAAEPRALLLGLDFWWFQSGWPEMAASDPRYQDPSQLSPARLRHPLMWLASGRLTLREVSGLVARGSASVLTGQKTIGVQAMTSASGFRPDGSYQYGDAYFRLAPELDVRFRQTLSRVETRDSIFPAGARVDRSRVEGLERILDWAAAKQMTVAMFLPPLAPPVREALIGSASQGPYIRDVIRALEQVAARRPSVAFYDFLDAARLPEDAACEYVDGIHGGDVIFARMLAVMSRGDGFRSAAPRLVDGDRLAGVIAANAGRTVAKLDDTTYSASEADFLGLGCQK